MPSPARLGLLTLLWMLPMAHAVPSKVRLEYLREATAASCPTQEALRASLSARLGRDLVDDSAPELLRIRVLREAERWRGTIEWFGASGKRKGLRELSSERADCQELTQALELAIALVIDPPSFPKPEAARPSSAPLLPPPIPPSPPAPAQSVQVPPSASGPTAQVPSVAPRSRTASVTLGLGTRASWRLLPQTALGLHVEGGLRFEHLSVSLDATAWLPRTAPVADVRIRSMLVAAGARACVHLGPFGACPQLSAGRMWCEGVGLENARTARAPWLAPGARLFAEWSSPAPSLRLQVLAEGQLILTRNRFLAGDVELWQSPLLGGSLGLMGVWDTNP
jgi:hypothetical protein